MKNVMKVITLSLALVLLVSTLAACGGVSGTYKNENLKTTYEFSTFGSDVTITSTVLGKTVTTEATYELNDDKNEITITEIDADGNEGDPYTMYFEKGDGYIKLGLSEKLAVKYTKQ